MSAHTVPEPRPSRGRRRVFLRMSAVVLVLFAVLALPLLARTLNFIDIGGAPLGFLIASQGAFLALILITWLFGRAAHRS